MIAIALALPFPASAANFPAICTGTTGDPASLVAAVTSANATAGPDSVTLGSGCTYTLTARNNYWYGPNGLPAITGDVTIDGHGSTIERADAAPTFRLFFVGADPASPLTDGYVSPGPGRLTLRDVTLSGGRARGGSSLGGGGGAGMGGAIFSQGSVVIERTTLTNNSATGGSTNVLGLGPGGGGIGTDATNIAAGGFGPGTFGGGVGGTVTNGAGAGGAGFRTTENGNSSSSPTPGAGGGPSTGLGGQGGFNGGAGGDGSGGGGSLGLGGNGGAFGAPGLAAGSAGAGGGGGGVGGGGFGGSGVGGGGGFGAGGGGAGNYGGSGGFGAGGGHGQVGGGAGGFGGAAGSATSGGGGAGLGGAIFAMQGEVVIRNSSLVGNLAVGGSNSVNESAGSYGGAVFNLNGSLIVEGATFSANSAPTDGAQIFNLVYDGATGRAATAVLRDTIVANGLGVVDLASSKPPTTAGPANLGAAAVDVGAFDLIRTMAARGAGTIAGSPLTADPQLGPLADNGGLTRTMLPPAGSPVIDAGGFPSGLALTTDQRGLARPFDFAVLANAGSGADIGAVEVQGRPDEAAVPATPATGGTGGGGIGSGSSSEKALAFGTSTLVALKLAKVTSSAVRVKVTNRNAFAVTGRLSAATSRKVAIARKLRVVRLKSKAFRVVPGATKTVTLSLPRSLRALLRRTGSLRLRATATVRDPAGSARRVTTTLKLRSRRSG